VNIILPKNNNDSCRHEELVYAYLDKRGIKEEIVNHLDYYRFGICDEFPGYLIMPVYDNGVCVYWTGRNFVRRGIVKKYVNPSKKEGYKGKSYFLYAPRLPHPDADECCLVEGPFDAIKMASLGFNALCCFNATPSNEQLRLVASNFNEINIWFDSDEAGKQGAVKAARKLHSLGTKVYRVIPSKKDPGEYESLDEIIKDYAYRELYSE